jgi:GT2 family glycosyltransferase
MPKHGVTVVIPSFTCKDNLFRLLNSLQKSTFSPLEIIVVDNGSTDNTLAEGRKKYRSVTWIDAGKKNIGQTGSYNLGFAHANKKNHIAMIDSDVVVEPTMISELVKRLEKEPQIGIVTPMILYLNDKNWVNQAGSFVDLTTGRVQVGWGPKKDWLTAKEVQNSGTVMLFKRELVNKIGGFDDWFLCYFDPDYCLRAAKAGFSMWYEPKAVCYHDQSKDPNVWRPRVLTRAYLLGRNRVLFMRKFGNMFTFTLFVPLLLGYYLIECIRFHSLRKFFELISGTLVGYFYPLNKNLYIPLPKV